MRAICIISALYTLACHVGAPTAPASSAGCAAACARVRELACAGWTSPGGASCEAVCDNAQANGASMATSCVAAAADCAAAERCSP